MSNQHMMPPGGRQAPILSAEEMSKVEGIQAAIVKRFDDLKLRQWCVEQAAKSDNGGADITTIAQSILRFITEPFDDILRK